MKKLIYLYGVYCLCLEIDDFLNKWYKSPRCQKALKEIYGARTAEKLEKVTKNQIGFSIGD